MLNAALTAIAEGLSVVPINQGTKAARVKWADFQSRIMTPDEARACFRESDWFALVAGEVSGNLELIDFDIPGKHQLPRGLKGTAPKYKPFVELCAELGRSELLEQLILMETKSGGCGLIYRCSDGVGRNVKLAERWASQGELHQCPTEKRKVLIETRGNGGYFLTVPSPGYRLLRGSLNAIPVITGEQREFLHSVARQLNECEPDIYAPERHNPHVRRPGDKFNATADWEQILTGWTRGRTSGRRTYWTRPGKKAEDGISASTGNGPNDLLYVFSTSAHPFEAGHAYTKFSAYALLNHGGDFHYAAKTLREARPDGRPPTKKSPPVRPVRVAGGNGSLVACLTATSPSSPLVPNSRWGEIGAPRLDTQQFERDNFAAVQAGYLVRPYLPKGKCVLLDADGGTGKTSLALAWAAQLSSGYEPVVGTKRETARTLYLHKGEDDSREMATVFHANDGDFSNIEFYDGNLVFNPKGLEVLEQTIVDGKFQLVVVDALFYFLTGMMQDTYNALPAMVVMQRLNALAQRTSCTFWNIRHTRKGNVGAKASDLGMGSVQFRNSHRGQILLRYHPTKNGVVVATDEKGSLLVPRGDHFCYRREDMRIYYLPLMENPFEEGIDESRLGDARLFLQRLCGQQWVRVSKVREQAIESGIAWRTVQRAANDLGIRYQKLCGFENFWSLLKEKEEVEDPFQEP